MMTNIGKLLHGMSVFEEGIEPTDNSVLNAEKQTDTFVYSACNQALINST
jgi:hypothetical protein